MHLIKSKQQVGNIHHLWPETFKLQQHDLQHQTLEHQHQHEESIKDK